MSHPQGTTPISNTQIIRLLVITGVGVLATHAWISLVAENRIDIWSALLLATVALYYAGFLFLQGKALRQRAYSRYFIHVMVYLLVNGSFWGHALVIVLWGERADLLHGWAGPLFGMSLIWGIGLLADTIGNALSSGYPDVEI